MRVAIIGAGPIGLGMAAVLHESGHHPVLFSPTGAARAAFAGGATLVAGGAVETEFVPMVAASIADALAASSVMILAVPGNAHRLALDMAAPHLTAAHRVVISSHCSLGALYLAGRLAERGVALPIVALGTTVLTGRTSGPTGVRVSNLRQQIDAATLPVAEAEAGIALCRALFGDRFMPRADLLAISLSNLNPQNHLAMALCNFTRIEGGEAWGNYAGITASVGRLIEALDAERLEVAAAYGAAVRSVRDHFHLSFAVPHGPVAEMAAAIHARGNAPLGPTTTATRYVLEDVPFGLVTTAFIAGLAGVPTPLHDAGIALFSAMYGQDFRRENDILPRLDTATLTASRLQALCREGWPV